MNADKLVEMANQIGDFFAAMPDRGQAQEDIANHLRRMWEPRMRRALYAYIDQKGGDALSDIVREAVLSRRADLEPPAPTATAPMAR